jgi:hypothetical protein
MTAYGREYIKRKLRAIETKAELRRVWGNMGVEYQHAADVRQTKDDRKAALGAGA